MGFSRGTGRAVCLKSTWGILARNFLAPSARAGQYTGACGEGPFGEVPANRFDPKTVMRYDYGRENLDQNAVNFPGYDEE